MLEGELGSSRPYHLKGGSYIPFARGSLTCFTLSLPNVIGPLRRVRVWHDNSGQSPPWFLNTIKIYDASTQELKTFMCYTWLAVEKADGIIDRTLTADSAEEKRMNFKMSFQNRVAEEFGNGHLWFSVATRAPRRRFTCVQRLSCCLSLLLTTMLASAMFYEFVPGHDKQQGTLRLGRLVVNLRQLIIAVESLLVVLPVNFLIVGIFSHVTTNTNLLRQRQLRYTVTGGFSIHKVTEKFRLQRGLRFTLPHCFVYLAWVLCFMSSVVSATFVILYSLQWGKNTSEDWLISIVMSVFVDIFVSEPVKIVVSALLLSHFCQSETEELTQTPTVTFADREEKDGKEERVTLPEPPSEKELRRARIYRMRELRMCRAIRKILSYLVYLWILMIICYGVRSKDSYSMTSSLQQTFRQLSQVCSRLTSCIFLLRAISLLDGMFTC